MQIKPNSLKIAQGFSHQSLLFFMERRLVMESSLKKRLNCVSFLILCALNDYATGPQLLACLEYEGKAKIGECSQCCRVS